MRTRPWTALIVVAGLAVTGCGGGESAGDGPRLTRAEARMAKRHHLVAQKVLTDTSVTPTAALKVVEDQCNDWKRSGATLRAVATTCDQAILANRELLVAEAGAARCSADDIGCSTRHFRRMAIAFGRMDRALQQPGATAERLQASAACRDMIGGSAGMRSAIAAGAQSSKALLTEIRGATAEANSASPAAAQAYVARMEEANKALADALQKMQAASDADLKIDAAACDGDAE